MLEPPPCKQDGHPSPLPLSLVAGVAARIDAWYIFVLKMVHFVVGVHVLLVNLLKNVGPDDGM